MPINAEKLLAWKLPKVEQNYHHKDSMLYALGLGFGEDPLDPRQLRYVYEDGLQALSTMAVVLGHPGFWLSNPDTGVDWRRLVHGEQGFVLHKPLPIAATVTGHTRVTNLVDKGAGKGAFLYTERTLHDSTSGEHIATLTSTSVLRGDGGFGGPNGPTPTPIALPSDPAHEVVTLCTSPQSALLYRLSGDYNPLHADPRIAAIAGFDRPILHGLCTFGFAGRAILASPTLSERAWIREMRARFSAPVYPGETLRTEIWHSPTHIHFRVSVVERNVVVLNNGFASLDD